MKKKFSLLFVFSLLMLANIFADSVKSVSISTEVINIKKDEAIWLIPLVEEKMEANLLTYTDFILIDKKHKNQIIQAQKDSELTTQDSNNNLEIGMLKSANHGIFLTISKNDEKYSLTLKLTDFSSGTILSTVQSTLKNDSQELYTGHGSAVDEITIKLCEHLNLNLTNFQKHVLISGDKDLSYEEKKQMYDDEIRLYEGRINLINQEIQKIEISTDIQDSLEKKSLEAAKILAQEKLNIVEKNKQRAIEEAKLKEEEALRDSERTSEQKEQLANISLELNNKLAKLTDIKKQNASCLEILKIIELKKKTYLEVRDSIQTEVDNLKLEYDKQLEKELEEIENRPYRTVEKSKGNPLPWAIEKRKQEKEEHIKQHKIKFDNDILEVKNKINIELDNIMKDIETDYKLLRSFTVNSLSDDLIVKYSEYDGERKGWPISIIVQDEDITLCITSSFLSYKDLTGKKPNLYSKIFADKVDYYNSLFLRNEPIVTYELTFGIKPYPEKYPSLYEINISDLHYYDSLTLENKNNKFQSENSGSLKASPSKLEKQMYPAYNLMSVDEIEKINEKQDKKTDISNKKQQENYYKQKKTYRKDHCIELDLSYGDSLGYINGQLVELQTQLGEEEGFRFVSKLDVIFPNNIIFRYDKDKTNTKYKYPEKVNTVFNGILAGGFVFNLTDYIFMSGSLGFGGVILNSQKPTGSVLFQYNMGVGLKLFNTLRIVFNADLNCALNAKYNGKDITLFYGDLSIGIGYRF